MLDSDNRDIDYFVQSMIADGFYRFKEPNGAPFMYNGETKYSYKLFVKEYGFITGHTKTGKNIYLELFDIDRNYKDFPIITKTVYDINKPFGKVEGEPLFNTAKSLNPKFPIDGIENDQDVSIFWNHLEYLCGDVSVEIKEWVKDWLADIFQDPDNKKGTALVFIGGQGCGKSIFFNKLMNALFGVYFHHTANRAYSEKFNLQLLDKLLINFDEGFATKSDEAEAKLKFFITEPTFISEGKGTNSTVRLNPARAVFTTNSGHAISIDDDDRRFAIFRTIKQDFTTPEYFDNLTKAIADRDMLQRFMYELKTRNITSRLNIPPVTEEKKSQKVFSAGKISNWFDFIISTDRLYQIPSNSNFNYLWAQYEDNERCIFGEKALESFKKFPGNGDNFQHTNKLFTALKVHLENNNEWCLSNETKRVNLLGLPIGSKPQRVWVLTKKSNSVSL